jgi:hypothetical protein
MTLSKGSGLDKSRFRPAQSPQCVDREDLTLLLELAFGIETSMLPAEPERSPRSTSEEASRAI